MTVMPPAAPPPKLPPMPAGRITVGDVLRATAIASGVEIAALIGSTRVERVVGWRQAAMEVAAQACGTSVLQISRRFRRDHSTVIFGRRRIAYAVSVGETAPIKRLAAICRALHALSRVSSPPAVRHFRVHQFTPEWWAANDARFRRAMRAVHPETEILTCPTRPTTLFAVQPIIEGPAASSRSTSRTPIGSGRT